MKDPKKTKVVINDFVSKIQNLIDSAIKIEPDIVIWENKRKNLLKNCERILRELKNESTVSAFSKLLLEELKSNEYIYTRINTEGLDNKIEKIAQETLEDWVFTQEQYGYLKANNLSSTEEYL